MDEGRGKNFDEIRRRTVDIYNRHAVAWDKHRPGVFFEKAWLDQFIKHLPFGGRILDVGCGPGQPISGYLIEQGFDLTGLDASEKMLDISASRFPTATWIQMDMRALDLNDKFDGIISWDGFFHLTQEEQRSTLVLFADHLSPDGSLLLTIGHEAGEVLGTVEGEDVYHASLAQSEYEHILKSLGFKMIEVKLEDENCGYHSILLATKGLRDRNGD